MVPIELIKQVLEYKRMQEWKTWQKQRKKLIKEVNGFYCSTEQAAKTHVTKIKGRYL